MRMEIEIENFFSNTKKSHLKTMLKNWITLKGSWWFDSRPHLNILFLCKTDSRKKNFWAKKLKFSFKILRKFFLVESMKYEFTDRYTNKVSKFFPNIHLNLQPVVKTWLTFFHSLSMPCESIKTKYLRIWKSCVVLRVFRPESVCFWNFKNYKVNWFKS